MRERERERTEQQQEAEQHQVGGAASDYWWSALHYWCESCLDFGIYMYSK